MVLKEILKQATLRELENLNLHHLSFYSRTNYQIIGFLHKNEIIDNKSIERALEFAVISRAKKDYNLIVSKKTYRDHVARPECLAYAISHGTFSERQLERIPLDHGQTPETFCQNYGIENLLGNLRKELLNPRPLLRLEGACCSC